MSFTLDGVDFDALFAQLPLPSVKVYTLGVAALGSSLPAPIAQGHGLFLFFPHLLTLLFLFLSPLVFSTQRRTTQAGMEVDDDAVLRGVDAKTYLSLNGPRTTNMISKLIPASAQVI